MNIPTVRTPVSLRIIMTFFLLLLAAPYLCQANPNAEKEGTHFSIDMESDDSGSGDRTFSISLAATGALLYNKSVHMKAGDALRAKDNGGLVLLNDEMDYRNCNTSNPLHLFNSSNARYALNNPGTFYIISFKADLCNNGGKMMVKVQERESAPAPESIHFSIDMESDDSGSGDRTFSISLVATGALLYNKSVHMKAGDALRAKDDGGYALLNNEMDYLNCSSSIPFYLLYGENASYTLHNPGTFYIISSKPDRCENGAKVMIKVRDKENTPSPYNPNQISSSAAQSSVPNINYLMAVVAVIMLIICPLDVLFGY